MRPAPSRRGLPPPVALLLSCVTLFTGCSDPGLLEDDDAASTGTPDEVTPSPSPVGDDDQTTTPGDDDTTPGDDDDVTTGDDDDVPGDDDDTSPGDDDDFEDDDISFPDVGETTPPDGDDDASPGDPTPVPPRPPGPWWTGAMLVSDVTEARVFVQRLSDNTRLWDYSLPIQRPELCPPNSPCQVFEARHVVHLDRDYVDIAMARGANFLSSVHRVDMERPGIPVFSLEGFDFTSVRASGCTLPAEQTCQPDRAASLPAACVVYMTHGMQVIDEDPAAKQVTVVLTDSRARILQVTLDYARGNTCGRVDAILSQTTPGFPRECAVNDVQHLHEDGIDYLLLACRSVNGPSGQGVIQLFEQTGPDASSPAYRHVWTFPDPDSGSLPYLNIPHHARLSPLEDGGWLLRYAHSDGLGTGWNQGSQGTIGSARLETLREQPDYLADEAQGLTSPLPKLGFVKSVEILPGGERLVVDTGSSIPGAPVPGGIYVFGPQSVPDTAQHGYWTQTFEQQNLIDIGLRQAGFYSCNWTGLYSAYHLAGVDHGTFLRQAMALPEGHCAPPMGSFEPGTFEPGTFEPIRP